MIEMSEEELIEVILYNIHNWAIEEFKENESSDITLRQREAEHLSSFRDRLNNMEF